MKIVISLFLFLFLFSSICFSHNDILYENIISNKWEEGKQRQLDFFNLIENNKHLSDYKKLKLVNDFINLNIYQNTDMIVWESVDYWSSPLETLNQGAGDCEDFAIIKYFALKKLGINYNKLRFFYVKHYDGEIYVPHMILAYSNDNLNYFILDNLNKNLLSNNQRQDLIPIFSFNESSIFTTPLGNKSISNDIPHWQSVFTKTIKEGF